MNEKTVDFTETLGELDAGVFASKLTHALAQCALGVVEHGRKGEVAIKFTLTRIGDSHQINMQHRLDFKAPTRRGRQMEEEINSTMLYVGPKGSLTVMPLAQGQLFPRDGEKTTTEEKCRG